MTGDISPNLFYWSDCHGWMPRWPIGSPAFNCYPVTIPPTPNLASLDEPSMSNEATRLNVYLSKATAEELDQLLAVTSHASKADAIRAAIKLYSFVANEVSQGATIQLRAKDGAITTVPTKLL